MCTRILIHIHVTTHFLKSMRELDKTNLFLFFCSCIVSMVICYSQKNQVMSLSTVLKNQQTKIIEFLYRKSFQILYKNKSVNSDSNKNYHLLLNNDKCVWKFICYRFLEHICLQTVSYCLKWRNVVAIINLNISIFSGLENFKESVINFVLLNFT